MKIFLIILCGTIAIWPIICWFSYHTVGWKSWESRFARKQNGFNTTLSTSVELKKFGAYSLCVYVGVEDFGIAFVPSKVLLFHKTFYIPWANIMSFSFTASHSSEKCLLNTNVGQVTIRGEIAEIVARGCESHFVSRR